MTVDIPTQATPTQPPPTQPPPTQQPATDAAVMDVERQPIRKQPPRVKKSVDEKKSVSYLLSDLSYLIVDLFVAMY